MLLFSVGLFSGRAFDRGYLQVSRVASPILLTIKQLPSSYRWLPSPVAVAVYAFTHEAAPILPGMSNFDMCDVTPTLADLLMSRSGCWNCIRDVVRSRYERNCSVLQATSSSGYGNCDIR